MDTTGTGDGSKGLRRPNDTTSKKALDPVEDIVGQTGSLSISDTNPMPGLRRPNTSSTSSGLSKKTENGGHGLNADAKVFVPSFLNPPQPQPQPQPQSIDAQNSFYSNGQMNPWQPSSCYGYDEVKDGDVELDDYCALSELKEFIDQVSSMPQLYDELIDGLTVVLNNCIDEDEEIVLQCIVNNIVDQSIIDPNFRFSGVRLCEHLISNLIIKNTKGTFKDELMSRCQREQTRRNTLVTNSDGSYFRGVTLVIADLSSRLPKEGQLIESIPCLMETLLNYPSADNVKTCCQVLKLCGPALQTKGISIQPVIDILKGLQETADAESTREVIKATLEYRDRGWKTAPLPANFYNPYAEGNIPPQESVEAAGFDPYGYDYGPYVVGEENGGGEGYYQDYSHGYDFGNCEDEQNDDVIGAFEDFLRTSGQTNE